MEREEGSFRDETRDERGKKREFKRERECAYLDDDGGLDGLH